MGEYPCREALAQCLRKLHARDRELVLTRYEPGNGVPEAAQRSGRSLDAAYKALSRIRKLLFGKLNRPVAFVGRRQQQHKVDRARLIIERLTQIIDRGFELSTL